MTGAFRPKSGASESSVGIEPQSIHFDIEQSRGTEVMPVKVCGSIKSPTTLMVGQGLAGQAGGKAGLKQYLLRAWP